MIALRDRKGRLWSARLTLGTASRLRDLVGLDVMAVAAGEGRAESQLMRSPSLGINALYVLCATHCDRLGGTDRWFGKQFRGVNPRAIAGVIRSEVAAFFRVPGPAAPSGGGRRMTADELWRESYRLAGIAGVVPDDVTFGELVLLAEGRRRHDWPRTATVLSFIAGSAGKRIDAAKLDPTGTIAESAAANRMKVTGDNLSLVAMALMG